MQIARRIVKVAKINHSRGLPDSFVVCVCRYGQKAGITPQEVIQVLNTPLKEIIRNDDQDTTTQ